MHARRIVACFAVIGIAFLILCVFFVMNPGLKDFTVQLPKGYHLFQYCSTGNVITDQEGWVVIDENVDGYKVLKHLVIGHVTPNLNTDRDPEIRGFFILDTKNGHIQKGLTKSKWLLTLREQHKIDVVPKLKRPMIYDAFF